MTELVYSFLWVVLGVYLLRRLLLVSFASRWRVALLAALVLGATVLRLGLATWGPGDLRMTTATVFENPEVSDDEPEGFSLALSDFGPATDGLLRLTFLAAPATDRTTIAVNILLGGLCALLAALLVEALGLGLPAALAAGLLTAVMPLLVRFSGEGSRATILLFASLCGLWLLAEHVERRRSWPLALGAIALVLAVGCRPEAALVGPSAAVLLVLRRPRRGWVWWARLGVLAVVAATALANQNNLTSLNGVVLVAFPFSSGHTVWLDPGYTPLWMTVAFLVALPLVFWGNPRVAAWCVFSLAVIAWVTHRVLYPTGDDHVPSTRYQVLALPFVAIVTGAGFSFVLARLRRFVPRRVGLLLAVGLAFAVVVASWPTIRSVTARRTLNDEYDLFREVLPGLPADAEIYFVAPPLDTVLWPPRYLATMFGRRDLRWRSWPPREETGTGPRYYWRGSGCSLRMGCGNREEIGVSDIPRVHRQCAEADARFGAHPETVRDVPAAGFAAICYEGERVRIGLYAMD